MSEYICGCQNQGGATDIESLRDDAKHVTLPRKALLIPTPYSQQRIPGSKVSSWKTLFTVIQDFHVHTLSKLPMDLNRKENQIVFKTFQK